MKLRETENIVILGIFLALTGLVSALVLAVVSGVAAGPIKAAELRNATAALKDVLPAFDNEPSQCKTVVDGMAQNVSAGDVITMSAGCRHTIIAETELKLMEVQLGKEISAQDKQKYALEL